MHGVSEQKQYAVSAEALRILEILSAGLSQRQALELTARITGKALCFVDAN